MRLSSCAMVVTGTLLALHGTGGADELLLAVVQVNGLPTSVEVLDPATGNVLGTFIDDDYPNNGMLDLVEAICAGAQRTVLFGQPGGNGKVSRYDETGAFLDVLVGGTPDPNGVDNIRGMIATNNGQMLITADWDDSNDMHRFRLDGGVPAGQVGDALGLLVAGGQTPPLLVQPQAIEQRANGEVLVADIGRQRLVRYNSATGAMVADFSTTPVVASVNDIDEQSDGRVVIAEDGSGDRITTFAADGTFLSSFSFNGPEGVHVLPSGDLLVTSSSQFGQGKGLFRVSPAGVILQTIDSKAWGIIELVTLLDGPGCPADLNNDGVVNGVDVGLFLQAYSGQNLLADLNGSESLNGLDVGLFLQAYSTGCP